MAKTKKTGEANQTPKKGDRTIAISSKDLPKKNLEDALKVAHAIKENYGKQATWDDIAKAAYECYLTTKRAINACKKLPSGM